MELTNEERETHLNLVAADRSTWHVYSDDPVMQRRLENACAVCVKVEKSGGKHYTLPANHLSFRKPRQLSDEQREALAARLAQARNAQAQEDSHE